MIFPALYAMNSIAETVAFLVKPPTLDEIKLNAMGMLAAKGEQSQIPTRRPYELL